MSIPFSQGYVTSFGGAALPSGRLQIWFTGADQRLWSQWQTGDKNNPWSAWNQFESQGALALTVGPLKDGRLQLFIVGPSGVIWTCWKTTTEEDAPWTPFGQFQPEQNRHYVNLAIVSLEDKRLQLFATDINGLIWTCWVVPAGGWTLFTQFPMPLDFFADNLAIAPLGDGRPQLLILLNNGQLWSTFKETTDPNSGWSGLLDLSDGLSFRAVTLGPLSDGRLQIFASLSSNGQFYTRWKSTTNPDSGWTAWVPFAGPNASQCAAIRFSDKRLGLWAVDPQQIAWFTEKADAEANASWPTWSLLFRMQHQQQSGWCWAAVAASAAYFFDLLTTWAQCSVANATLKQTTCCQDGGSSVCNAGASLESALATVFHLSAWVNGKLTPAEIAVQLNQALPVGAVIAWANGGSHSLALIGCDPVAPGAVVVGDPWYGTTYCTYDTFCYSYQGDGNWKFVMYMKSTNNPAT